MDTGNRRDDAPTHGIRRLLDLGSIQDRAAREMGVSQGSDSNIVNARKATAALPSDLADAERITLDPYRLTRGSDRRSSLAAP